jgi:hypothetical protein
MLSRSLPRFLSAACLGRWIAAYLPPCPSAGLWLLTFFLAYIACPPGPLSDWLSGLSSTASFTISLYLCISGGARLSFVFLDLWLRPLTICVGSLGAFLLPFMSLRFSSNPPAYQHFYISDCLPACVPVCFKSLAANLPSYLCLVHVSLVLCHLPASLTVGFLSGSLAAYCHAFLMSATVGVSGCDLCLSVWISGCLPASQNVYVCMNLWLLTCPITCLDLWLLSCLPACTVCMNHWLLTCPIACLDLWLPTFCLPVCFGSVAANLPSYLSGICLFVSLAAYLPPCRLSAIILGLCLCLPPIFCYQSGYSMHYTLPSYLSIYCPSPSLSGSQLLICLPG